MAKLAPRWRMIASVALMLCNIVLLSPMAYSQDAAKPQKDQLKQDIARTPKLMFFGGGGDQPHADNQTNAGFGFDWQWGHFPRSMNRYFHFGVSVTHLSSDTADNDHLVALSIYPQLTLYADPKPFGVPFFFVRALGPTYISEKQLGEREQGEHFCFLAQVGAGLSIKLQGEKRLTLALSNRHFSNAGWFDPNDGIDLPLVLTIGFDL